MKTVFINCSPKKRFSASSYFLLLQKAMVKGSTASLQLRNKSCHNKILVELPTADTVVFCLPLYVDSVPSHVLSFMIDMEQFCKENDLRLNVYVISNCGFIEGRQCEPLMRVFRNFCSRSNLNWQGGIGIGGGVMLNVTRILFFVQLGLLVLNILLNGIKYGNIFPAAAFENFAVQVFFLLFLNIGVLFNTARMGHFINHSACLGEKYTRVLLPSFLFIVIADIFFILISIIQGGIFKGWLSPKA